MRCEIIDLAVARRARQGADGLANAPPAPRYGYEVLAEADASPSQLTLREYGYDAAALAGLAALHARCAPSELTLRECAVDSFLPPKGVA